MAEREVSDSPVLRHLLPHQGHLQGPMGAGLGVQRPVVLTLHLGGDGGGSGYRRLRRPSPGAPPRVALAFSIGDSPRPGNQVESRPSQEASPLLRSSRAALPRTRPSGCTGGGGRGAVVLGTVSGAGSQAGAWRAAPQPGARGSPHPAGLHAVGQHDQGVALLLPHQAPEVAHGLRQGALGRDELLGAPETLVEGGRRVRAPLPPALTFRGSEPSLTPALRG